MLLDYDNVYAPEIAIQLNYWSWAGGNGDLPLNFRHPQLADADFAPWTDYFQSWLLDTMILCWSADRPLWKHTTARQPTLFSETDLLNPEHSALFNNMQASTPELAQRARFLIDCLKREPKDIPPLTADGFVPQAFS